MESTLLYIVSTHSLLVCLVVFVLKLRGSKTNKFTGEPTETEGSLTNPFLTVSLFAQKSNDESFPHCL